MPRYEYSCKVGHEFEAKAGFDDAEITCPMIVVTPGTHQAKTCGQIATRKGVQKIAGVIFSGGGFTRSST